MQFDRLWNTIIRIEKSLLNQKSEIASVEHLLKRDTLEIPKQRLEQVNRKAAELSELMAQVARVKTILHSLSLPSGSILKVVEQLMEDLTKEVSVFQTSFQRWRADIQHTTRQAFYHTSPPLTQ